MSRCAILGAARIVEDNHDHLRFGNMPVTADVLPLVDVSTPQENHGVGEPDEHE